ncbi:RNA polymerase sigma factor [Mucilaginibacter sp. OK283]|jgi:RNA polymerase sigma-70 factor (ECF subfamily)|uniref:RNA polymerase sigma factor n=1 Tax=Mucilaginibacter sp. OK283 TaxID=1881049 RepID=UPI0008AE8A40|nr:RNA polymerase sigma-70 factor [Mucilaginibacter sp. OK283]SEO94104.1 RNA polymerase sigma-70 factor, ECF subfamily [Mucilaginibacter sp. OK283]
MTVNDIVLCERLMGGDVDAYKQIYDKYHSQLYYYALRFLKMPELAEDVIHDVFLKLWEIREQLKPEYGIAGYLYKITRNQVFKLIKKIAAETELRAKVISIIEEQAIESEADLQWNEYAGLLGGAVEQLPPQCKKVFNLCRQEGKTYDEAAQILGISKHTVKEHMMAAMKSIKKYFRQNADIVFSLLIIELMNK